MGLEAMRKGKEVLDQVVPEPCNDFFASSKPNSNIGSLGISLNSNMALNGAFLQHARGENTCCYTVSGGSGSALTI